MTENMNEGPLTDADVLRLIKKFEAWRVDAGVSPNSGLWQMLIFLRRSIEQGEPLYAGILERQRSAALELANQAVSAPSDMPLAADYLSERLHGDIASLDYDCAFLICGQYFKSLARAAGTGLVGRYNVTFGPNLLMRQVNYWSVYRSGNFGPDTIAELERPIVSDILRSGFNLPMYVDSMQFGQGAWGEGADIVAKINEHIQSPASQGQFCSLTPPDIKIPVDWRRNDWAHSDAFLDIEFSGTEPLPVWVKDIIHGKSKRH